MLDLEKATLLDVIQWRADRHPDKLAYMFLDQGEIEADKITYADLNNRVQKVAAHLQETNQPGDLLLLLFPTGVEFVVAFFAGLFAGMVPIPTNPPRRNRPGIRLRSIIQNSRVSTVLTSAEFRNVLNSRIEQTPEFSSMKWIEYENAVLGGGSSWRQPSNSLDNLAFIQYTSGSTTDPKGVMVSHRNLAHNVKVMFEASKNARTDDSVYVSWLPLFHDMGLIGGVVRQMYAGNTSIMMQPIAFLQKPVRWLQAITKYRAAISGGPNFSYDFCVDKIAPEERSNLDLSSWKYAYNGSEPVRMETIDRFAKSFAPFGFNPLALDPVYGLAEITLTATANPDKKAFVTCFAKNSALGKGLVEEADPDDEHGRLLLSSGRALADLRIIIVDPQTLIPCADSQIGEIWISGDSVAKGYWNNPEQTSRTFGAFVQDGSDGPFLRTGDLGFLRNGNLFIAGRHKDMIIINGRNLYPQDIELSAQSSHIALEAGNCAAFSIEQNGSEAAALICELKREFRKNADTKSIINNIRAAVARDFGFRLYAVSLVKPQSVPKTSSGKIMRNACRKLFISNKLELIAEWRAPLLRAKPNLNSGLLRGGNRSDNP